MGHATPKYHGLLRYLLTVLLGLDQLINAIGGGFADETISYRASIANAEGKAWGCWFCGVVEYFLPDHCSLETDSKALKLSRGATWSPYQGGV